MNLRISDKRKRYGMWISICLVVILLTATILYTIFSLGFGQRMYRSELSNVILEIPRFSFGVTELQDEETYCIQFYMVGGEEHIVSELTAIESNVQNIYAIDQWAVNNSSNLIKTVVLTYVIE